MSRETLQDLNTNTLIGNTDARGHAWHYRAEEQGTESNHYPGPIPIEDVRRRLFCLDRRVPHPRRRDPGDDRDDDPPRRRGNTAALGGRPGPAGHHPLRHQRRDGDLRPRLRAAPVRRVAARHGRQHPGRRPVHHLRRSAQGRGDRLGRGLRPGVDHHPGGRGVPAQPAGHHQLRRQSTATTFKRTVTDVVCDNTRDLALAEPGQEFKVKHSRYSIARLGEAREALAIIHTLAEEFAAEVAQLCATPVTPAQWDQFLDLTVPRTDTQGQPLTGRSLTMADTKRSTLERLYAHDARVAPWAGTAHGVLQAVNTFEHHEGTVRGATRAERNMLRTINGDFGQLDRTTLATLDRVLTA